MNRLPDVNRPALRDEHLVALMRQVLAMREADVRTVVRDAAQTIGADLERQMRTRWGTERAAQVLEGLRGERAG